MLSAEAEEAATKVAEEEDAAVAEEDATEAVKAELEDATNAEAEEVAAEGGAADKAQEPDTEGYGETTEGVAWRGVAWMQTQNTTARAADAICLREAIYYNLTLLGRKALKSPLCLTRSRTAVLEIWAYS